MTRRNIQIAGALVWLLDGALPPEGFDPLTASGEELEEYAIPPRPTDPESLGEWEEEMMEYQAPTSPTAPACRISAETELSSLDPPHPGRFVAVQGSYTQAEIHPDSCERSEIASWIGLGGYGNAHLIQAGTTLDARNHIFAWYEWIGPSRSINPEKIEPLRGLIEPGDHIHLYVSYSQANPS